MSDRSYPFFALWRSSPTSRPGLSGSWSSIPQPGATSKSPKKRRSHIAIMGAELRELTGLRLRSLLTDAEFATERVRLQEEEYALKEKLGQAEAASEIFSAEPGPEISFHSATLWSFSGARRHVPATKRLILKIVSSNPTLKDKILSVQAAKPFLIRPNSRVVANCVGVEM